MFQQRDLDANNTAFYFNSLTDILNFVNDTTPIATGNASRVLQRLDSERYIRNNASDVTWYGTTDVNSVRNPTTFLLENELERQLDVLRSRTYTIEAQDLDQNKQIKFTEKEIGIFSFDLASLGLIPVYEFYSPILKNVVSGNVIFSEKNQQGVLIFYHKQQDEIPQHQVEYNVAMAGYYSPILKRVVDKSELIETADLKLIFPFRDGIEQHIVERRHKLDAKGNKMFTTTFKKSFIEIPKVEKPMPRIDLLVGTNFSSGTSATTEMMFNSLPAIALAEKLTTLGIPYRIIACYGGQRTNKNIFGFTALKKEGEIFNKNQLSINLSDGRYIRGTRFKAAICMQFLGGVADRYIDDDISVPIRDPQAIKSAYINFLRTSDNPEDIRSSENPRTKIAIAGSLTQTEAQAEYERIIQEISRIV